MKTRDALANDVGLDCLTIIVDEPPAKENIVKYVKANHYEVDCQEAGGEYTISICTKNKTR
jgi:TusA-related sulfurtransferase